MVNVFCVCAFLLHFLPLQLPVDYEHIALVSLTDTISTSKYMLPKVSWTIDLTCGGCGPSMALAVLPVCQPYTVLIPIVCCSFLILAM